MGAVNPLMADYGVLDSVRGAAASLQDAAQRIGSWLADSFQTVTSVRVSTFVSDNIADVKFENGTFTGAKLRAMTVASLDGNTVVCVPENRTARWTTRYGRFTLTWWTRRWRIAWNC